MVIVQVRISRHCSIGPNGPYWAEILDQGRISCSAGILDTVFSKINFASRLCAELQDKLALFHPYELSQPRVDKNQPEA